MNPAAGPRLGPSFAIGIGAIERFSAAKARRAVPIRIHVNGTRGKSTVTRLSDRPWPRGVSLPG
jgi:hypothetical protein